jgi:hypothetical protein
MLIHTHISSSIFFLGTALLMPLLLVWGVWVCIHGMKISNRMLIRTALLLVIVFVPMSILFEIIPVSLTDMSHEIIMIGALAFYWSYCILRLIRYSERGQVLLRASGINLQRFIGLILGVIIFLMLGRLFFDYVAFAWPLTLKLTPRIGDICCYMLILTLGIQSIIWSAGWQITENGILSSQQGLTKWSNIKSYNWSGDYEATLVLHLNKGIWKNIYLRISQNQKDSVEAILSEKTAPTAKLVSPPA